jgi:hypothetical protein
VLPDTESINPFTQSLPFAEADGDDDEVAELVGFAGVGFALFDAPHAATDSTATPVSVTIANRLSPEGWEVTDIEDPFQLTAALRRPAEQHISGSAAQLSAGQRPIMNQLCIRLGRAKALEQVTFWS